MAFVFKAKMQRSAYCAKMARILQEPTCEMMCEGIDMLVSTPRTSQRASKSNRALTSVHFGRAQPNNKFTVEDWGIKNAIEFKNSMASRSRSWDRQPWRQ